MTEKQDHFYKNPMFQISKHRREKDEFDLLNDDIKNEGCLSSEEEQFGDKNINNKNRNHMNFIQQHNNIIQTTQNLFIVEKQLPMQ